MKEFRNLRADEIDCRVATVNEKGLTLLLYKDARCDMNILDETVGPMNWQRKHTRDNANCIVSIWDDEKKQWIEKEDTGTESFSEAAKGLASDSFKRACFNWGIGRELYTAPFIWIGKENYTAGTNKQGKPTTYDTFSVTDIEISDKKVVGLAIKNNKTGTVVYTYGKKATRKANGSGAKVSTQIKPIEQGEPAPISAATVRQDLKEFCLKYGVDQQEVITHCGLNQNSVLSDFIKALDYAKGIAIAAGKY